MHHAFLFYVTMKIERKTIEQVTISHSKREHKKVEKFLLNGGYNIIYCGPPIKGIRRSFEVKAERDVI